MKTWEMIKELTEKPHKKYVSNKGTTSEMIAQIKYDCIFIEDTVRNTITSIDVNREWEEVKEPVSWEEAVKAWANGKKINCKVNGKLVYNMSANSELIYLRKTEILNGEWHIED